MTSARRLANAIVIGLLLAGIALAMIRTGTYGLTLFIALPIGVGAFGAWLAKPTTAAHAIWAGMIANAIASAGFLFAGFEGLICIAMALPLALPLGALGGWLVYRPTRYLSSSILD